jgi:deoxycytidylate deaminase
MSGSIKLHKEHGLAPAMSKCFVCGEVKNELYLLGSKAPKDYSEYGKNEYIFTIEPCEVCKEKYLKSGVLLVEGEKTEKGMNITGSFTVLKDEAFKRIFNQEIPSKKICFVEIGLLKKIGAIQR